MYTSLSHPSGGSWQNGQICNLRSGVVYALGYSLPNSALLTLSQGSRVNWLQLAWKYIWRPRVDPMELVSANKSTRTTALLFVDAHLVGLLGFNLIWLWDNLDGLADIIDHMLVTVPWMPPHIGAEFDFDQVLRPHSPSFSPPPPPPLKRHDYQTIVVTLFSPNPSYRALFARFKLV